MGISRFLFASACASALAACQHHAPAVPHASASAISSPSALVIVQPDTAYPPSNNRAAASLAASPRRHEWVKLAWTPGSPDSLVAWVVYPANGARKAPVVVVVHEIFGLSTWVRSVADELASQGFVAIAPDLVSRARGGPSTVELSADSAVRLIRGVSMAERNDGIVAAGSWAMSRPEAEPKYAVIGFCWGGQTTWGHAVHRGVNGFAGGVAFYGLFPFATAVQTPTGRVLVPIADSMAKIQVPMMLLSGSQDAGITAQMPYIDSMMTAMHKPYFGRNYEGAVHGFVRAQDDPRGPGRDGQPRPRDPAEERANVAALKDAWPRTIVFLREHLGAE